jgi:hypothetical protein
MRLGHSVLGISRALMVRQRCGSRRFGDQRTQHRRGVLGGVIARTVFWSRVAFLAAYTLRGPGVGRAPAM